MARIQRKHDTESREGTRLLAEAMRLHFSDLDNLTSGSKPDVSLRVFADRSGIAVKFDDFEALPAHPIETAAIGAHPERTFAIHTKSHDGGVVKFLTCSAIPSLLNQ